MQTEPIEPQAFTINEFCAAHRISRPQFYILERKGQGPQTYKFERRRYISREAAEAWRRRMEMESESEK